MKVSIVLISYNQGRFLEQAVNSVLSQDYKAIEFIVVDPGSTDGSLEIIDRFRERITKLILEPDRGPADGLNKAFNQASGEIFAYLCADDYYYPSCVSKVIAAFRRNPDLDMVCGNSDIVGEGGRFRRRLYSDQFSARRTVYGACTIAEPGTFFKAQRFREIGGYNSDNHITWDHELWVMMALNRASFGRINEVTGAHRVYPGTITSRFHSGLHMKNYKLAIARRVLGREWRKSDVVIRQVYRILRFIQEPRSLYERLIHGPA